MKNEKTNWYVITGGPSAGKTLLIEALDAVGVHVEYESARLYIDEQLAAGKTIEEIRNDEEQFQEDVWQHKLKREKRLDPNETFFFDRGVPDTYAYNKLFNFRITSEMQKVMDAPTYKKIFLLDTFEFKSDYARTESPEEARQIHELLREAYERTGIPIVTIPAFPTKEERVAYFFDHLRKEEGFNLPQSGTVL